MVDDNTQQRILDHVYRYRITTPQVLQRIVLPQHTIDDVRFTYRELKRKNLLAVGQLYHGQPYYSLTPTAAKLYNTTDYGPYDERTVVDPFAMLMFCTEDEYSRRKLSPMDMQQDSALSTLIKPGVRPHMYYVDTVHNRLGYAKVDRGMHYVKAPQSLEKALKTHTEWTRIIAEDGSPFVYTILTAHQKKKDRLLERLSRVRRVRWEVHVVKELCHVITAK